MNTSKSKNESSKSNKKKLCYQCKVNLTEVENYNKCSQCNKELCLECYEVNLQDNGYCPNCKLDYPHSRDSSSSSEKKQDKKKKVQSSEVPSKQSNKQNSKRPSSQDLAKVRVIKQNLVYVIGLSPQIASEETLNKYEYFGQYGKITKIVVNKNNVYNPKGPNGPSYSAYITYLQEKDASIAILAVEEFVLNERTLRASYGTTKYCTFFLKNQECPNKQECLYLHSYGNDIDQFLKDDMISNKNIFSDQQKLAIKNVQKFLLDLVKIKMKFEQKKETTVLPHPASVVKKLIENKQIDIDKVKILEEQEVSKNSKAKKEQSNESNQKQMQQQQTCNQVNVIAASQEGKKQEKKTKIDDKPFIDQWAQETWSEKPKQQQQQKSTTSNNSHNSNSSQTPNKNTNIILKQKMSNSSSKKESQQFSDSERSSQQGDKSMESSESAEKKQIKKNNTKNNLKSNKGKQQQYIKKKYEEEDSKTEEESIKNSEQSYNDSQNNEKSLQEDEEIKDFSSKQSIEEQINQKIFEDKLQQQQSPIKLSPNIMTEQQQNQQQSPSKQQTTSSDSPSTITIEKKEYVKQENGQKNNQEQNILSNINLVNKDNSAKTALNNFANNNKQQSQVDNNAINNNIKVTNDERKENFQPNFSQQDCNIKDVESKIIQNLKKKDQKQSSRFAFAQSDNESSSNNYENGTLDSLLNEDINSTNQKNINLNFSNYSRDTLVNGQESNQIN